VQYSFSQVAQFDHQNDPLDLAAFLHLPGKKSDNGDFGIEAIASIYIRLSEFGDNSAKHDLF
jgi:hypothetical protein